MSYDLHAVIIHKPVELKDAKKIARHFIAPNKKYYRETENSYRFRNIPKTKFKKRTFRTKKLNEQVSLIYGQLQD